MSDFDTRPKGTVMYGAFKTFAPAERALRVLKNAGYARAAFEGGDSEERASDEPAVVVVDAAAAGATRAAEILEEYGAQIRFAPERVTPEPQAILAEPILPEVFLPQEEPRTVPQVERKPRVRRRALSEAPRADVAAPSVPLARQNVVIVTRAIESIGTDGIGAAG